MAGLDRLLQYFRRENVTELLLETGHVVAVKINGDLRPVSQKELTTPQLIGILQDTDLGTWVQGSSDEDYEQGIRSGGHDLIAICQRRADKMSIRLQRRVDAAEQGREIWMVPSPCQPAANHSAALLPSSSPSESASNHAVAPSVEQNRPQPSNPNKKTDFQDKSDQLRPARTIELQQSKPTTKPIASIRTVKRPVAQTSNLGAGAQLQDILRSARNLEASDVHICSGEPVRFRIMASLSAHSSPLEHSEVERVLKEVLNERDRDQLESLGYCDFAYESAEVGRFRVNVCRHKNGYKGCFRVIAEEPSSLKSLGLPSELAAVTNYHQGLAIVSGPNGQGKSTTLAALVDLINSTKAAHVITVEDPVEIIHPIKRCVITQRQIGEHTKSFQSALKAALREDPDVIVIGELRDRETVEMALSAAETGHLVIATMNTPSGAKTIGRLIDLFPPDDQSQVRATLAGALKIVVSQRLIPRIEGNRCIAAAELITGDVPLWSLIRENKLVQLPGLMQRGRSAGMIRLDDSLKELLSQSLITKEVALQFAEDPRVFGGTRSDSQDDQETTETATDNNENGEEKTSRRFSGLRNLLQQKGA